MQQQLREGSSQTTNIANISIGRLSEIEVPLPPLLEQKRIADKLERLLSRVDAARERLERVPGMLKRFRASVLEQAVSGELTREWREENADLMPEAFNSANAPDEAPNIPKNWTWVSVGEMSKKIADGVHKKPDYIASGIPFVTVRNLTSGKGVDLSNTNFITEQDHKEFCKRTHPEKDDILLSKDGTLGVVRLIETEEIFSIFVSVALIKLKDNRMSRYTVLALESPIVQKQMVGVGTGLQHIHLRDLKEDVLPLPPLLEQTEIVRRVGQLFTLADQLEGRFLMAKAQLERLTPALLAKAFRGELVEQDPTDEPASVLLERIRAEREVAGKKVLERKPRVSKERAGTGEEAKPRGRPAKARENDVEAVKVGVIPRASSVEDAVKLLERKREEREAVGTVQGGLFD